MDTVKSNTFLSSLFEADLEDYFNSKSKHKIASISVDDYDALREIWIKGGEVTSNIQLRLTDLKAKGLARQGFDGKLEITDSGLKALKHMVLARERSTFEGGGFDYSPKFVRSHGRGLNKVASKEGYKIKVEIADDDFTRTAGLMGRDSMSENEGMLFIFPTRRKLAFWMSNTKLPLDLSFINDEGEIKEIYAMVPHSTRSVASQDNYRLALETLSGVIEKKGYGIGAKVEVKDGHIEFKK